MSHFAGDVLGQLDRLFNRGTVAGLSEGTLLERFATGRDEAAFAALVALHGPMVLGVCRRSLRDEHDVEDAFQATFLVLVRRAGMIRQGDLVGHWLYGVAHRVAVRARANAARRNAHERTGVGAERNVAGTAPEDPDRRELRTVLDEELVRLPDSLRRPLVLCYLDGLSHDEAARRLGWPVGTVRSRMARARGMLRKRLAGRGVVLTGTALSAALAAEPVPAALLDATVRAALSFSTRPAIATTLASATAAALAKGVLNAMTLSKLSIFGGTALACLLAIGGAQSLARQKGEQGAADKPVEQQVNRKLTVEELKSSVITELLQQNAALNKEVQSLKDELDALRATAGGAAPNKSSITTSMTRVGVSGRSGSSSSSGGAAPGAPGGAFVGPAGGAPGRGGFGGLPGSGGMIGPGGAFGGSVGSTGPVLAPGAYGIAPAGAGTTTAGQSAKSGPQLIHSGRLIVMSSPEGDKVSAYSIETGKTSSFLLTDDKGGRPNVTPIVSQFVVGLYLKGPKITRIAAYSSVDGKWHAQDLREPVTEAIPQVSNVVVTYTLGRRVYAFSAMANRWGVVELPEGSKPHPAMGPDSVAFDHGTHIYVFSAKAGEWEDLDTRALVNSADEKKAESGK